MAFSQANRPFAVASPLGTDVLLLLEMTGREQLSGLFQFDLVLLSEDNSIAIADVLGQDMTVRVDVANDGVRYFNGVVSHFAYVGQDGQLARYTATLRPWLWYLTRTADCRIFPNLNSIDTLRMICGDLGFTDIDDQVSSPPDPVEFRVQYRESAFQFISRILEHDGIYYYFKHEDGKHEMVLCDGIGSHSEMEGYGQLGFFPGDDATPTEADRFASWYVEQEVQSGTFAHRDFDFTKPKTDLTARSTISRQHPESSHEVYDYPGIYKEVPVGEALARVRIEALQANYEIGHGKGTVRGLGAGALFELTDHPRADLNKKYLVLSSTYQAVNPEYETVGAGDVVGRFDCEISVLDERTQFRPARTTPRPTVEGPQTAIVVGQGDDVWTDEYGRIKVQFHWDRLGTNDEASSCWIRVSQNWAGKNWGGMFLPHIGQEVIVDFLEGDPDQPIVTGRVYNAENMPPLSLPDNALKSIIRDNYGNQIVFDATPGDEHLVLQSPHHDSTLTLGKSGNWETKSDSRYFTNGTASTQTIGSKSTGTLGNAFSYTAGASESLALGVGISVFVGFKVDVSAATKLAADVGGSMTFYYNYSYKWGWGAETNVNKKDFLRSSSSNIVHDSLKNVICVGGKNDNAILDCGQDMLSLSYGEDPSAGTVNPSAVSAGRATLATITGAAAALAAAGTAYGAGLRSLSSDWAEQALDTANDRSKSPLFLGTPYLETLVTSGIAAGGLWAATFAQMKGIMDAAGKEQANQSTVYSFIEMKKDMIEIRKRDSSSSKAHIIMADDGIEIVCPDHEIEIRAKKLTLDAADGVIIKKNKMKTQDGTHAWNM